MQHALSSVSADGDRKGLSLKVSLASNFVAIRKWAFSSLEGSNPPFVVLALPINLSSSRTFFHIKPFFISNQDSMLTHQSRRRMKLRYGKPTTDRSHGKRLRGLNRSHSSTPLANEPEQSSTKRMSSITMLEAKKLKATSEALLLVGKRSTATRKAEARLEAEKDRDPIAVPQLSLISGCEYHRSILEGMINDTSKSLTPMEKFSREIPAKHFAFHVHPDTGEASTRQACRCMLFSEEMLDISEDEME
jgi:hypothetical protein